MNYPKINERTMIVQKADCKFIGAYLEIRKEFNLTDIEAMQILNQLQASCLKYMLRAERHPEDPSESADLE